MGRALHAAEDLLGAVRSKKAKADRAMIDALLECIDASDRWIELIASTGNLPTTAEQEARSHYSCVGRVSGRRRFAGASCSRNQIFGWQICWPRAAAGISSGPVTAVRYVPDVDAFLNGDDPVLFARSIPQLLALRITGRDAWNSDGFDPYRCNLVIEALSDAPIDEIREVFASIAEQVIIVGDVLGDVPPEALSTAVAADNTSRSVRVDAGRIDALVDLVGELIVAKNNLGHLAAQAADAASPLASALAANYAGFERLTGDMHRTVMRMRMIPLARTFGRFPRWMRDTAAKLGKEVEFRDFGQRSRSRQDGRRWPL